tara:strand:+ start:4882 stop:5388 length:507 start_codon:yes stop_codon:yes gene_type:complete
MGTYVPPHRRNNLDNINNISQDEQISTEKNTSQVSVYKKSFADVIKITNEENNEINYSTSVKPGWSLIKKDKYSKIIVEESEESKTISQKLEAQKLEELYFKNLNKMFENWNTYRDNENLFRGDNSPYINYKEELEIMKMENIKLEDKVIEYNKIIEINNSDSDDEEI